MDEPLASGANRTAGWAFTCRHGCEALLAGELLRLGVPRTHRVLTDGVPIEGLVWADLDLQPGAVTLRRFDPVYALQVLPAAIELRAPSIAGLADAAWRHLAPMLKETDGPWRLHALVPGQLKGTPKPRLRRRADLLADAILERCRTVARLRARAWLAPPTDLGDRARLDVLAQVLLLEPERMLVSVAPVWHGVPQAAWPARWPAGLFPVADDPVAPASSFRKLWEALAALGEAPTAGATCVDLGAAPGGWTRVLRVCGANVVAVDRAPLTGAVARDPQVRQVIGDAFRFRPATPVDWVVSDVIAFPERVAELVEVWCGQRLARRAVLQMKFRGAPDWAALDGALAAARGHGWTARAKHLFNDKNEVTLLLADPAAPVSAPAAGPGDEP